MADTGFIFPGTMVGNRANFGADIVWSNPDNAKADDGSNATVFLDLTNDISFGLAASNFGFSALIPAGATIDGIEVQIGDYSESVAANHSWGDCILILADGTDGSENKNAVLIAPSTTLQTDQAGGPTDLWGETITRADVIDVDWGFWVSLARLGDDATQSVDFLQMKVFYTESGGGGDGVHYRRRHIGFLGG